MIEMRRSWEAWAWRDDNGILSADPDCLQGVKLYESEDAARSATPAGWEVVRVRVIVAVQDEVRAKAAKKARAR